MNVHLQTAVSSAFKASVWANVVLTALADAAKKAQECTVREQEHMDVQEVYGGRQEDIECSV